jgi:hypothetical protein
MESGIWNFSRRGFVSNVIILFAVLRQMDLMIMFTSSGLWSWWSRDHEDDNGLVMMMVIVMIMNVVILMMIMIMWLWWSHDHGDDNDHNIDDDHLIMWMIMVCDNDNHVIMMIWSPDCYDHIIMVLIIVVWWWSHSHQWYQFIFAVWHLPYVSTDRRCTVVFFQFYQACTVQISSIFTRSMVSRLPTFPRIHPKLLWWIYCSDFLLVRMGNGNHLLFLTTCSIS